MGAASMVPRRIGTRSPTVPPYSVSNSVLPGHAPDDQHQLHRKADENANLCCTAATVRFKGAIKQNTHLVLSQNYFTHENIFSQGRVDGHKGRELNKTCFLIW